MGVIGSVNERMLCHRKCGSVLYQRGDGRVSDEAAKPSNQE